MADLLTMSIAAVLTNTNETQNYGTWPYSSTTTTGHEFTETPDEFSVNTVEAATGGGSAVDVSEFTTVTYLGVYNTDGANFITVSFDNAAAATVALKVLAGQVLIVPDVDPSASVTIVADTAACFCKTLVTGT
jgi:hypothetical protein